MNLSSPKIYFVNDGKLLQKAFREDNKSFHSLIVSQVLTEYILYQAHDVPVHNGTARMH